ncbi:hypothetical protein M406DRAFT_260176 [Cryphonectria parasitica EP155]|uniref:Reverse transcriptase domain-containing protein n=1 Tax=Cryphonectria parasitica (strain ATCC 38755 / EP155) TaxID=660469 RepID=A0A9P4Y0S6_CRYP1|nr:uncharacterized protein M406DRAFT_260176 [Cryphonectria parasitica EP155]KAF3764414.1 hypothetical protein M406DRAFT_260176 [Cryphonectria parasitica EP155]
MHYSFKQLIIALISYCNSLAYAQRYINRLLCNYKHFIKAFIDNIVIFLDLFENYLKHLNIALNIFNRKGISISPTKSYISFFSVELLSFYINALSLFTIKEYTEAFRKIIFPRNLKDLEIYLSATSFL